MRRRITAFSRNLVVHTFCAAAPSRCGLTKFGNMCQPRPQRPRGPEPSHEQQALLSLCVRVPTRTDPPSPPPPCTSQGCCILSRMAIYLCRKNIPCCQDLWCLNPALLVGWQLQMDSVLMQTSKFGKPASGRSRRTKSVHDKVF